MSQTKLEFKPWPKIQRIENAPIEMTMVVTEKLDGTNACVIITDDGQVGAQSRNRMITPEDDNFGFARWVKEHEDELRTMGRGHHFGEWWGAGIGRGYGRSDKLFSLFNTERWLKYTPHQLPQCVGVVPVLYDGPYSPEVIESCRARIRDQGSLAVPGYMRPEGLVVYIKEFDAMRKVIIDK